MSLPTPNLDDRTFKDIVKEAIELIPKYCPEWTDFNPSDPGITLIELFAWMTEMVIYRLNRVPEKNYIKFLELMGTCLKPSQPAQTWVVFTVASKAKEEDLPYIPPGTQISTGEIEGEPIVFETVESLNLTSCEIIGAYSKCRDEYTDLWIKLTEESKSEIEDKKKGVSLFDFKGEKEVPHRLYLGDPLSLGESLHYELPSAHFMKYISLTLHVKTKLEYPYGLNIEWEYWDGTEWQPIVPLKDDTLGLRQSGEIVFDTLPEMREKEIYGLSCPWLRARLLSIEERTLPKIETLNKSIRIKKEHGLLPQKGYLRTEKEKEQYTSIIDFSGIVYPFGIEPKSNDAFYIESWIFSRKEARIQMNVLMAESFTPQESAVLGQLEVSWEYFSETEDWRLLGITSPLGVSKSEHGFEDETDAFTKSGRIRFICPKDIDLREFHGEKNCWIRARIIKGNYGTEKAGPPIINTFLINYEENIKPFEHYLTYNYFSYKELTELVRMKKPFELFEIIPEKAPTVYLGFKFPFSNKVHRVYFRLAEKATSLSNIYWEYFSKTGWKELNLRRDSTHNFSQNGVIEFIPPTDWKSSITLKKEGYWLRARWEVGGYSLLPCLKEVHLNAVAANHCISVRDEILGRSNGEPYQSFSFTQSPILPGVKILVKEVENPLEDEIKSLKKELKEDVVEEVDPNTGKVISLWRRWSEVINFFKSSPESRHYTLDSYNGTIYFGDGRRGMIPPPMGKDNIKCEVYYVGGGSKGNVGKNSITVLVDAFPHVDSVRNPDPTSGGADSESIEEAKLRGPWLLKHRNRAVTKEDFERLALEASGDVAKAVCYSEKEGQINLIIMPKEKEEKPLPKNMLVQKVRSYLDVRRLITTKLNVVAPTYIEFSIEAEIVLELYKWELVKKPEDPQHQMKIKLENELKSFFHPLNGGPKGDGWPMGRDIHISEIYYLLEKVEGVDYVKKVALNGDPQIKEIEFEEMSFPYLKEITIEISSD